MNTTKRGRGYVRNVLPPAEEILVVLAREKLTRREYGARFGVSEQAVSNRINRHLKGVESAAKETILPWRIRPEHSLGRLYTAVLAYGKQVKGRELKGSEPTAALHVPLAAERLRAQGMRDPVLSYTQEMGFFWRNRKNGDPSEGLLV